MQSGAQIESKLKNAFKELVMTEPVEKITIAQITGKAGVIRTTFYHHFQDYMFLPMILPILHLHFFPIFYIFFY